MISHDRSDDDPLFTQPRPFASVWVARLNVRYQEEQQSFMVRRNRRRGPTHPREKIAAAHYLS